MTAPRTAAGRALHELMLDINEPGGYDMHEAILAIEAEAAEPYRTALDDLFQALDADAINQRDRIQSRDPLRPPSDHKVSITLETWEQFVRPRLAALLRREGE